jgi:hypothetical protein
MPWKMTTQEAEDKKTVNNKPMMKKRKPHTLVLISETQRESTIPVAINAVQKRNCQ